MAFPFSNYYRSFGIRRINQLTNPNFNKLKIIQLPRESIYVYLPTSEVEAGPGLDDPYLKQITRPVFMYHVMDMTAKRGNPRPVAVNLPTLARKYHVTHRRYRLSRDVMQSLRDPVAPFVVNMALMGKRFKYFKNIYTEYNKWYNNFHTSMTTVAKLASLTSRNIFFEVSLPKHLPPIALLRQMEVARDDLLEEDTKMALGLISGVTPQQASAVASESLRDQFGDEEETDTDERSLELGLEAINTTLLRKISGGSGFTIVELWKWLGIKRDNSLFTLLSGNYDKVNLIFRCGQFWTVLNLGVLDSWRKSPAHEKIAIPTWDMDENNPLPDADPKYVVTNEKGITTRDIQIRVLKFLMRVYELDTLASRHNEEAVVDTDHEQVTGADTDNEDDESKSANADDAEDDVSDPIPEGDEQSDPADEHDGVATTTSPVDALVDSPEEVEKYALDEKELDAQIQQLMAITDQISKAASEPIPVGERKVATPEEGVMAVCDKLAESGSISAIEYKNYQKHSTTYQKIEITHQGKKTTLGEFLNIPKELAEVRHEPIMPDKITIPDKSMLYSSLNEYDEKYIKHLYHRDIAGMAVNLQKAGIAITDYETELVEDASGSHHVVTIRANPVIGAPSILRMRVPDIDDEGVYETGGIKYRMRKQRGDLPIRKISSSEVALTSYYGKLFVERSQRRSANYTTWLNNSLMAAALDKENTVVTSFSTSNVFDNKFVCPRLYSIMAQTFSSITIDGWTWVLDHTKRAETFGTDFIAKYEQNDIIVVASNLKGAKMLMDSHGGLYSVVGDKVTVLPPLEEQAGLALWKRPVEYTEIKVAGKFVPIGIALGYYLGYTKLCRTLGVSPRIVPVGTRVSLEHDEYAVVFSDETHVFSKDDAAAALIMGGFYVMSDITKSYSSHEFDKTGVYLNVIEAIKGGSVRQIRELDLLNSLFIDPITLGELTRFNHPTDWVGLLMKASGMLTTDHHADEVDPQHMRTKGYERVSGIVYKELVAAVRMHNSRSDKARQSIEINPHAVWQTISQDPTVAIVEDTNPIQNLKEAEAVTYSGVGGRSTTTMTRKTRIYHKNELGTISESTVDSGEVGVNVYLSANPTFNSLRGTSTPLEVGKVVPSSMLSSSALISPGSDRDDPRRVNFIAIQQRHVVPCKGYRQAAVRTGYEQAVGHRTGNLFCTTAKQDGVVTSLTEHGIIVKYKDGTTKAVELGRRYGAAAGLTLPHTVVTDLKVGSKVKAGDPISYHPDFFERDLLDPSQVIMKTGALATVALMESSTTLLDSSAISKGLSDTLETKTTKIKYVVVDFKQHIHKCVSPGTKVKPDDILCIIEDQLTAESKLFDEASLETLRIMGSHVPTPKVDGVVERIEVFYHGELDEMSDSLRQIASYSDRQLSKRRAAVGKSRMTGSVSDSYRVEGTPLQLDTAVLKFYITSDVSAGVGDKMVFGNQMKTVVGSVLPMDVRTETGTTVDAIFGQKSIDDRIVCSPELIGTTTVLLELIGKRVAEEFFK